MQAATKPKDFNCILIWTHGGTSHHDTLDPKPNAPVSVRGEFGAISTAVPGVQFSEICPNMAAGPSGLPCCAAGTRRTGRTAWPKPG